MVNPASQLCNSYRCIRNCGAETSMVFARNFRYNSNVDTSHKYARSVFISRPEWAAGIRKWLRAMDCVNNQSSI